MKSSLYTNYSETKYIDIRDLLNQMNMNERIIYPGIDGIAKWLSRHYSVKGND